MNPKIPLLLAAVIIIAFGCIGQVYGIENVSLISDNGTAIVVATVNITPEVTPTPVPTPPEIIRIHPGDTVYLNETVDISAVTGWADHLAYNDGYPPEEGSDLDTIDTPDSRAGYYNYYIDPSIFGNRLGYWYAWYGKIEPAGNLAAFYVSNGKRPIVNLTPNITEIAPNITPPAPPTILPEVHVSNYVVAVGDPVKIDTVGGGKVWLFGTEDGLYDIETKNDNITITSEQTSTLSPGEYTLLIQTAGKNGEFDVRYSQNCLQYRSAWDGVKSVDILGLQPIMVVGKMQETIAKTDDNYILLKMTVGYPKISIDSMYEVNTPPSEDFNFNLAGVTTWFDVRGYTNLAAGTELKAVLDKDQRTSKDLNVYTFPTYAVRSSPGNMSQYEVFVPIEWEKMAVGMHTITVESPDGAITYADFPVSIMPADSYRPNATLKYTGDRNPYVPPVYINTTVTVEKTVEVIKEVKVEVPPPVEVVEAAQRKAVGEIVGFFGTMVVVGIIISGIAAYTISVYRRAKKCQ